MAGQIRHRRIGWVAVLAGAALLASAGMSMAIDTMPGASTKPRSALSTNASTALLSAIRVARHEGYDRIVFQFRNNILPGYEARYIARPVYQDASGRVVAVKGAYILRVRMSPAFDADLNKKGAPRTYNGPLRISPSTPEVAQLVRIGGFENVLTWALGVRDRVDFRVITLHNPARIVVDLRNH
jgi:hypothetical protein